MGRPSLGDQALTTTVGVRFSPAEMKQIRKLGKPASVVRRLALEALVSANENLIEEYQERVVASVNAMMAVEASENPPEEASTPVVDSRNDAGCLLPAVPASEKKHRHRREWNGDRWVNGTNIGTWICRECGDVLP